MDTYNKSEYNSCRCCGNENATKDEEGEWYCSVCQMLADPQLEPDRIYGSCNCCEEESAINKNKEGLWLCIECTIASERYKREVIPATPYRH